MIVAVIDSAQVNLDFDILKEGLEGSPGAPRASAFSPGLQKITRAQQVLCLLATVGCTLGHGGCE
jgi:hypothetical protein